MQMLENKIPPLFIFIFMVLAMKGISMITPSIPISFYLSVEIGICLFGLGLIFIALGHTAFARAKTTFDPRNLERASSLVTYGIYSFTRNPMYVGFWIMLIAWAVYLSSPWSFFGPIIFVIFITKFQIIPEERVMTKKFGSQYLEYQKRVRRWV